MERQSPYLSFGTLVFKKNNSISLHFPNSNSNLPSQFSVLVTSTLNPNDADNHQPLLDLKSPSVGVAPSVGSTFDARRDVLEHLKARHQLHKKKRGASSSKRTQGIQTAPGEMPRSSSLTDSSGIPSSLVSSSPGASFSAGPTNRTTFRELRRYAATGVQHALSSFMNGGGSNSFSMSPPGDFYSADTLHETMYSDDHSRQTSYRQRMLR